MLQELGDGGVLAEQGAAASGSSDTGQRLCGEMLLVLLLLSPPFSYVELSGQFFPKLFFHP